MTVAVVLDGSGLHAWAQPVPPPEVRCVMEILRRHGAGQVIVPSVVTVEALTGGMLDENVDLALRAIRVESELSLDRTRRAARLRHGLTVSAADAVVAESVVRNHADFVITSDPEDLCALFRRGGVFPEVVVVGKA